MGVYMIYVCIYIYNVYIYIYIYSIYFIHIHKKCFPWVCVCVSFSGQPNGRPKEKAKQGNQKVPGKRSPKKDPYYITGLPTPISEGSGVRGLTGGWIRCPTWELRKMTRGASQNFLSGNLYTADIKPL